jgi:MFS family permease
MCVKHQNLTVKLLLLAVPTVWGMVSDSWGRKTSFGLATLFTTVFGFATAAAPNFHVGILARHHTVLPQCLTRLPQCLQGGCARQLLQQLLNVCSSVLVSDST